MWLISLLHKSPALRTLAKKLFRNRDIRQSFHGGVIFCDSIDHSWAWTGHTRYETFDADVQAELLSLSAGYDCFLDVGCNVGAMSLSVLLRNPKIRAVLVDPNKRATDLARRSIAANGLQGRARVLRGAASDSSEPVRYDSSGSVVGHVSGEGEAVQSFYFPDLVGSCLESGQKCLIKMDVEGYESVLLKSLSAIRGRSRICLVIELHPAGFNGFGDPEACRKMLADSGAVVRDLSAGHRSEFCQVAATWPNS